MEDFTLPYIMSVFRRRNKAFLITFATLFICADIVALSWSSYQSIATVEIQRPEIPQNITVPDGSNYGDAVVALADQHISELAQNVTSLNSLSEIITKFNLYPNLRNESMAALADTMRNKIGLDFISSQISNPAAAQKETVEQLSAIAFVLSFDYNDPAIAQQVTGELVQRFLAVDERDRHTKSKATSTFLATQIKAMEVSMEDQEKKIAEFKSKYGETGPTALVFNQQASVSTLLDLHNIESQITANEGTQGSLRAQLATVAPYSRVVADGQVLTTPSVQLKALEAQYASLSGQYGPEYPDVVKLRSEIKALKSQVAAEGGGQSTGESAQLKAEIADVRTNLAAAVSTQGPDNPDVIALKYKLSSLEKQLASKDHSAEQNDSLKKDADNPAYLSLIAQLHSAEEQHKSLIAQRDALIAQQAKYQHAIAENPSIEGQMAALTRDYENSQQRYRQLKERQMTADMSQQLEQDQKGQRLVVINPPSLPTKTHPSRLLIMLGGLVIALFGGTGMVVLLEAMNQNVYGPNHLATIVGAPPMVSIPYISTSQEHETSLRLKSYCIVAGILAGVITAAFVFFSVPTYYAWNLISHLLKFS